MSANGIAHLSTKELKQKGKLDIASAKRQGKVVAVDGTITGDIDPTQPYYRVNNSYDLTELPAQYVDDTLVDNPNPDGLLVARPWIPTVVVEGFALDSENGIDLTTEGGDLLIAG